MKNFETTLGPNAPLFAPPGPEYEAEDDRKHLYGGPF